MSQNSYMETIFTNIYRNNIWIRGSGWGSWIQNTKQYVDFLSQFLDDNNIKSVVDVGCGDWEFSQHINWNGIDYLGIDVVPSIIDDNNKKFSKSNIKFLCHDSTKIPYSAELIIVKDVLAHWSNQNILEFFLSDIRYRYMLITNDCRLNKECNTDTTVGSFQNVDIRKPPFNQEAEEVLRYDLISPKGKKETKISYLITRNEVSFGLESINTYVD